MIDFEKGNQRMSEDTRSIYERSGWGGALRHGDRPAILVVDFVNGFTSAEYALGADLSEEIVATRTLLDVARRSPRSIPIVFTTIEYAPDLSDAGRWPQKCSGLAELIHGSPAVQVDERLGKLDNETLIVKKGASALFGTNLAALFVAHGVDTVVLSGASTSGCIRATAIDLMQYGFAAIVPKECVGDRSRVQHDANLFDIHAKYADVCELDDVIRILMSIE